MSLFTLLSVQLLKNILEIVQSSRCHGKKFLRIDTGVTIAVHTLNNILMLDMHKNVALVIMTCIEHWH